jgi:polysaccharide biosynthesis/export protein
MAATVALAGCAPRGYRADLFEANVNAPYALASGDRLRIIVFGQDALSNSYSVDGSGNISMPLIGPVHVQGLTTRECEGLLQQRYREGFLREPRISAEVEAFRPFFILGEVTTAGQYPYVNGMTVETAVAIAGGFTPRGYQWSAEVTRNIRGRLYSATVPMTERVRPGDTISIKERYF